MEEPPNYLGSATKHAVFKMSEKVDLITCLYCNNTFWENEQHSCEKMVAVNEELEEVLETLADVLNQACSDNGGLDSMCLSSYKDGIKTLEKYGKVKVVKEYGRGIVAEWILKTDKD